MRKFVITTAIILAMLGSWAGGWVSAKCPEIIECPEIEVTLPDITIDCKHKDLICPDCICYPKALPAPECDQPKFKIPLRIIPIYDPGPAHLVRLEVGSKSWSTGYIWNRRGLLKPSVTIMQSNERFTFPGSDYASPFRVDYTCFEATAGFTIGLGHRR